VAALRGLGAVRGLANDHGFAGILGREAWVRGSTLLRTGDLLRSCEAYREAVGHFDAIRDWDSATAVRTLLSKNAANLGDRRPLDENSARALSESGRLANPRRRARVLVEIAETIGARAKPRVALDLLEEGIAANVDDPELRARLRITRGHLLRAVGRLADARLELEAAEPLLGEIPSEALRAHQRSNLLVSRAALALSGDPSDALAPLDEACAFFERAEHRYYTITARVMRARARRALGDLDGAEDDLRAAIAVDERNASQLAGRYSPSVFDRPQDAYDEMTELLAESRGRPNAAFAVAEMARARALSADLRAAAAPPDLDAVRAGLPVGVVMLAYAALDDRLYVWAVSRTGADWRVVPEPVESLAARARALSVEQEADEAQTPHQTELLYDLLVRPVETRLAGCESVVVVASDPLVDVPFAILFDGARKRYLVEACAITVAPSAGVYLACLERDAAFGGRTPHSALVIGDPAFDPASFPSLPRLPAANAEARNVAALYTGNVEILTAAEATERRVVERAPAFGVLHFAGHGLLDAQLPDLSALLLAPEAGGDGRLCAYEFAKLRLPKTRVAVLAACRTGVVPEGAVDAVSALSRALLLSGVPTVVVSWRDVDDRATAVFSAALHTALRNGAPPDQAVRSGQLALLNDPDPRLRAPKMWGAFGLVGGARGAATP
jgi:CHAT domain-containing protein